MYSNTAFIPVVDTAKPDAFLSASINPPQQPQSYQNSTIFSTGIYNYANSHRDTDCAAEASRIFGNNLIPAEQEDYAALAVGNATLTRSGYSDNPEAYFRAQGWTVPTGYGDYTNLVRIAGKRILEEARNQYDQNKALLNKTIEKADTLEKTTRQNLTTPNPILAITPEFEQDMREAGAWESYERAAKAMAALGLATGVQGEEKAQLHDANLKSALEYISGDEIALDLTLQAIADIAQKNAGKAGFFSGASEYLSSQFNAAVDAIKHSTLTETLASQPIIGEDINNLLKRRTTEAVNRFADDSEWLLRSNPDEYYRQLEQVKQNVKDNLDQYVALREFSGKVKAAIDAGRTSADEAGTSGWITSTRRYLGQAAAEMVPFLMSGVAGVAAKGATFMGMHSSAVEQETLREREKGFIRDSASTLESASNQALGQWIGMTVGGHVIKKPFSLIQPALAKSSTGIARQLALGGARSTALNYGINAAIGTADVAIVIPTATALSTGALNLASGMPDEYSHAYNDYVSSLQQLGDPEYVTNMLLEGAIFAPVGMRDTKQRARQTLQNANLSRKAYMRAGGTKEDWNRINKLHPVSKGKRREKLTQTLREQFNADPITVWNRSFNEMRIAVNEKQAADAMQDSAARAWLALDGYVAEEAPDNKVRIYTEAKVNDDGSVDKGAKFYDVDQDTATSFLGRIHEGKLKQRADYLRQLMAGKLSVDGFLKLYGRSAREEILPGVQTLADMQRDAERALRKKQQLMAGDESKAEAAGKVIDPEISTELTLDALIDLPNSFEQRLGVEKERGGKGKATAAYVVPVRMGDGSTRYVLRHAANADFFALSEELGEQSLLNYQRIKQAGGDQDALAFTNESIALDLLDLREWMKAQEQFKDVADNFLGLDASLEQKLRDGEPLTMEESQKLEHAVVEAFSSLFRSGLVSDAMEGKLTDMPTWVSNVFAASASASAHAVELATLGKALRTALSQADTPEGQAKYQNTVNQLWMNHKNAMRLLFEEYREPTETDYLKTYLDYSKRQDEQDARVGRGVSELADITEDRIRQADIEAEEEHKRQEQEEETLQQEEQKATDDLRDKHGNEEKTEEELHHERVETFADAKEEQTALDPASAEDPTFSGGRSITISADGFSDVRAGMLPVDKISLSKDVPQFKRGADTETGVVNELTGLYRPDHDPIRVWERLDGSLEVISGRHRLDYARKAGATRIMAYVYKESAERDARWARTFDLEQNIRDNQATELEIALYVRGENAHGRQLADQEIQNAGISRKGTRGELGVTLGRYAADEIIDAIRNERVSVADAVRVVEYARSERDIQREGLRVLIGEPDAEGNYTNGGSISEARRTMQRFLEVKHAMEEAGSGEQGDLFGLGFGESLQDSEFNRFFGKYQTRKLKEISADKAYLNKLVGGKLSPKQAEKYGIDIKDPDGLQKRLQELSTLYEMWKNPSIHPELMEEMTRAFKEENAGQEWLDLNATVPSRPQTPNQAHFSLGGELAATFGEMQDSGLTYYDPADGKYKFCIDSRGARLSAGFTTGQLTGIAPGKHKDVSLASMLAFPELFRAYPELAKMRVRLYRRKGDAEIGVLGYFDPYYEDGAHIALNMGTIELMDDMQGQILDTLLHEAQHAIQHHEGWSHGAGGMSQKRARKYVAEAIIARKEKGVDDEWSKANLAFLNNLLHRINQGDAKAIESVYWLSHGEQEARFAGASGGISVSTAGFNPMTAIARMPGIGVSSVAESWMTVPVPANITPLGGITFGMAGRYAKTMDSRLAPVGDFNTDRRLYQMREAVMRRAFELSMLKDKENANEILLQCVQTANTCVNMLPNEYRFGLEPYQLWFSVFSQLGGTGNPDDAADIIPMQKWEIIMRNSFRSQMSDLLMGRIRKSEMEFWMADEKAKSLLARAQEIYEAAREQAERMVEEEDPDKREKLVFKMTNELLAQDEEMMRIEPQLYKSMGKVKAEKVMAKLLERVKLKLDEYRKDKTLGRIRRVVDSVLRTPGKDGKPVKGKMDSDHYKKLEDYLLLLDMKKGELEAWIEKHYPEDGDIRMEDEPLDKLVSITTYDRFGKEQSREFTIAEINTYASFESMSADAAERMSRALGEFISTGRNAWDNAQQAHRNQIVNWCTPLLRATGALTESDMADIRTSQRKRPLWFSFDALRSFFAPGMNDVQFFDSLSGDKLLAPWANDIKYRLAHADNQYNFEQNNTIRIVSDILTSALGTDNGVRHAEFITDMRMEQDTGIILKPQKPDYFERESAVIRKQILGLLQRKVEQKNFAPHVFAPAIRHYLKRNKVTPEMRAAVDLNQRPAGISAQKWAEIRFLVGLEKEILAKYGHHGKDFTKLTDDGNALAYHTLFSATETKRIENAAAQVGKRVQKALAKWEGEHAKKFMNDVAQYGQSGEKSQTLRISKAEAAYQLLLCKQDDLRPLMESKGYTEAVIAKLEAFVGKDMLGIAYKLREALNARTERIAEMYERIYGVPFPRVDNYFRAFFDVTQVVDTATALESHGNKAAAGKGKEGILRTRSKSLNKKLDLTVDVFGAFETAMKEQSVFLNYGLISRDLTSIINFKDGKFDMANSLTATIGESGVSQLRQWADAINWLVPQSEAATGFAMRLVSAMQGVMAKSLLSMRAGTALKQWTSLFNSVSGSDYINGREWLAAKTRVLGGRGIITLHEMATRPALAARFRGRHANAIETAIHTARGKQVSHKAEKINNDGMAFLEYEDSKGNIYSATILYDAVYRKLKKANPEMSASELDTAAMAEVELSLATKSQPFNFRQKSLDATKTSIWKIGGLFLGSESINTFSKCASLASKGGKGNWGKALQLWLTHGFLLQAMQAGLDWLIDDEKRHNKRTLLGYLLGSLLGPISGIPFISQIAQGGIAGLQKLTGVNIPVYAASGLLPFADIERTYNQLRRDIKILTGQKKNASWENTAIAFNDIIRTGSQFTAMGAAFGTGKGAAIAYGSSLAAAAVSNLLDFLLKVTRTFEADRK